MIIKNNFIYRNFIIRIPKRVSDIKIFNDNKDYIFFNNENKVSLFLFETYFKTKTKIILNSIKSIRIIENRLVNLKNKININLYINYGFNE